MVPNAVYPLCSELFTFQQPSHICSTEDCTLCGCRSHNVRLWLLFCSDLDWTAIRHWDLGFVSILALASLMEVIFYYLFVVSPGQESPTLPLVVLDVSWWLVLLPILACYLFLSLNPNNNSLFLTMSVFQATSLPRGLSIRFYSPFKQWILPEYWSERIFYCFSRF